MYKYKIYDPRKCELCGETFTPTTHNQRFCSPKCRKKANIAQRHQGEVRAIIDDGFSELERRCPICGKHFIITPLWIYKVNQRAVCSWGCVRKHEKGVR